MAPHPSLSAPSVKVDPIRPVETMGPYEPCWCRSGKKYKWCHFRRDLQKPVNFFEIESKMIAALRDGFCSYPDPAGDSCSSTIAKAHTIQKMGGLAAIAEAGHVLTVKPILKHLIETEGDPSPRKIGLNNASVFPGFCSKHDDALFKPIEGKSVSLTKDSAFLFSYRAIAYERFAKEAELRHVEALRESDRGWPFWKQAAIQGYLSALIGGIRLGIRDLDRWKKQFDEYLLSGARDAFHFLAIRFDRVLPIVACGTFHPEFDFRGDLLQRLGREGVDFDHITLTVTAFEGQTIMVLGWIGRDDGTASALADSFLKVADARKPDALVRLGFIQTVNLFIQPSWWDGLPSAHQAALRQMVKSGTTIRLRSGDELADDKKSFVAAEVVETLRG
jgi:SEC-C motif